MPDFLSRVAADMVERFGNDFSKIAVVFNNQRPQRYLKQYLAERIGKAFWSPQFFTIQEFIRSSTRRTEASMIQQVLLLYRLHNDLQRRGNSAFEESLDQFFPVAEVILGDFAQLDYDLAPVHRVFQELSEQALLDQQFEFLTEEQQELLSRFWAAYSQGKESQLNERFLKLWRLLPQMYDSLKQALHQQGAQTMAGMYRDLAEGQPWVQDVAHDYDSVLFVGFNALNACEATLFKRWQEEGKALFYFDGDPYYIENKEMEAGFFIRRNLGSHGLRNALGDFQPQIEFSEELGGRKHIEVISVPGHQAQAKLLAQLLGDEVASVGDQNLGGSENLGGSVSGIEKVASGANENLGGSENLGASRNVSAEPSSSRSSGQTAVILADETLLIPVLQSIPSELEVNVTMGYPMRSSMTHSFIELYAEIQLSLRNNRRHIQPPATATSGTSLDGVENTIARIPSALLLDLVSHPFSFCSKDARRRVMQGEALDPADQDRISQFCTPVDSYQGFLTGLELNLQQLLNEFAPMYLIGRIEMKLVDLALQALRQFRSGFDSEENFSLTLCVRLLRRLFSKISASLPGDPLSGIQIMGLLESRNLSFQNIYLLGANEGILPSPHASPTFIPYNIRRAFGLPVMENQQALTAYLFYRLLHGVEHFSILYNGIVEGGTSGELSRFVRQLKYESSLPIEDRVLSLRSESESRQDISPRVRQDEAISIPKEGRVWEALQRYLLDSSSPEKRYLSASAFTLYLNSPLEFFFKYIAGIKEPPEQETDIRPNQLGTVIHGVMERLYLPYLHAQKPIGREECYAMKGKLKETCLSVIYETLYGVFPAKLKDTAHLPALTSQDKIIWRLSEAYCWRYVQHDANLGAQIRLIELENDQDYLLDFPINLNGDPNQPASVALKGIIDRVDEIAGQRRIVDYKTGGDTLEVPISELSEDGNPQIDFFKTNWKDSNKAFIQTLFYTYIYEKKRGVSGVEPHLYSVRRMQDLGTKFGLKLSRKDPIPLEDRMLSHVKSEFEAFLRSKLQELFDVNIPFVHPKEATIYPNNYLAEFLRNNQFEPSEED